MPSNPLTETVFRLKHADGMYLMALSPKTDQPIWVIGQQFAWTTTADDQAAAMRAKLRGRGLDVRLESFSRAVLLNQPNPDSFEEMTP